MRRETRLRRRIAAPEADVDLGFDQVGEMVFQQQVELHAGVQSLEVAHQGDQHVAAEGGGRGHADHAVHVAAAVAHLLQRFVQQAQARIGQLEQARALFRQAQAARGAVEQAHAEVALELAHSLADGLRRQAELGRRLAEAAGADHGDE